MTKALADRLAEAFAEYLHAQARRDGATAATNNFTNDELIDEKYRGIRPAPGYPAQPDHTEKRTLFELLDAERATGIKLTESFAMHPAASVSGLYFAHPAVALLCRRPHHARPGRRLRPPQGDERRRSRTLAGAESGLRAGIGQRDVSGAVPCRGVRAIDWPGPRCVDHDRGLIHAMLSR